MSELTVVRAPPPSQAEFAGLDSRTPFDTFDVMELAANASAVDALVASASANQSVLFFPTDRRLQVRVGWVMIADRTLWHNC